ncbi:MAG: hypothetical protein UMS36scaffold28_49 [Phage 59_13]|nr:MAG: hypothetical protein UMS36scaffold28_49 [Phage 59_13]
MSATCKGCNKPITWGVTSDDKKIPLDFRPDCYVIVPGVQDDPRSPRIQRVANVGVNHFCTCASANDFSRSRKQPEARQ